MGGGGRGEDGSLIYIYICAAMKWGGALRDDTKKRLCSRLPMMGVAFKQFTMG